MVLYKCEYCSYETTRKNDYFKHLNRKNPCNINNKTNASKVTIKKNTNIAHNCSQMLTNCSQNAHKLLTNAHNCSQLLTNCSQTNKDELSSENYSNIFKCEFCGKNFTRNSNLQRHINKYCRKRPENTLTNNNNEQMQIEWKHERDHLYKVIENLSQSKGNTINNTFNQTININNFGEENLKYISGDFLSNLLKIPFNALPNLIKEIHFNPEHPENNNIKISNKKLPYAEVFKDNCWKLQDKKETINDLLDKGVDLLENHFDDTDDLNKIQKDRFIQFKTNYDDNNKDLNRKISKDVEICLLNGS